MTHHKHIRNGREPVAIIGGGIIGLAIGWRLARRGLAVTIFERDCAGQAASWAAAGMLAPHSEVGFEEEAFLELGLRSLELYPQFLDELAEDSGTHIELDTRGTLIVAFNRDDTERIRRLFDFRQQLKLPVKWLLSDEVREIEPELSPKVTAAIGLPDDGQVDNREIIAALRTAFERRGGTLREHTEVTTVDIAADRVTGVRTGVPRHGTSTDRRSSEEHHTPSTGTKTGEERHAASTVVLAAGCWSRDIDGIPEALRPPVRPVKGQLVSLGITRDIDLRHVVRAPDVYILPKSDGRVLVGATQEEMGFDLTPTAGAVMRLLERAWEAVPSIYDLPILDIEVGLRPGSRDNEPIIGATGIEGLYLATGHFRHGILLTPVTAFAMADLIIDGHSADLVAAVRPERFLARKVL